MNVDSQTGLLDEAEFIPSPNCDERPDAGQIDLLIIHNISLPPQQFGGPYISQLFTNKINPEEHPFFNEIKDLRVSAHLLIRRDGSIIQYVPFHKRAWHAGLSEFDGRERCNDFSIGIELEGADDVPYEPIQYQKLQQASLAILQEYPKITLERICGHCDVAPERKTDPGPAFDWQYFKDSLQTSI